MEIKNGFSLNWIVSTLKNPAIYLLFYYIKSLLCIIASQKYFPKSVIKHFPFIKMFLAYSQCCILSTKAYFTWDSLVTILGEKKESEQNKQRRGENTCVGVFF